MKKYVSDKSFEKMREENRQQPQVIYVIKYRDGEKNYAWSDDGEGFFFYDTLKELQENH